MQEFSLLPGAGTCLLKALFHQISYQKRIILIYLPY